MSYQVKIGKDVNTFDINNFYPLIGFNAYNDNDWKKVLHHSTFVVQVLDNNHTIGFGRCVDDGNFCMIYDIAVHPDYQRKGIGTLILNQIKTYINQNDFASVSLFYNPNDEGCKLFYEKNGFYLLSNAMRLKK